MKKKKTHFMLMLSKQSKLSHLGFGKSKNDRPTTPIPTNSSKL